MQVSGKYLWSQLARWACTYFHFFLTLVYVCNRYAWIDMTKQCLWTVSSQTPLSQEANLITPSSFQELFVKFNNYSSTFGKICSFKNYSRTFVNNVKIQFKSHTNPAIYCIHTRKDCWFLWVSTWVRNVADQSWKIIGDRPISTIHSSHLPSNQ